MPEAPVAQPEAAPPVPIPPPVPLFSPEQLRVQAPLPLPPVSSVAMQGPADTWARAKGSILGAAPATFGQAKVLGGQPPRRPMQSPQNYAIQQPPPSYYGVPALNYGYYYGSMGVP